MDALAVESRTDLATFIDSLAKDLEAHPDTWENTTLPRFLEALARYLRDLDGLCRNNYPAFDADEARWKLFAIALAGAQVYE